MSAYWDEYLDRFNQANGENTPEDVAELIVNGGASLTISPTTATVGTELTAVLPSTYGATSYQWMRDGVDISGEVSDKYTVTGSDAGKEITARPVGMYIMSSGVLVEFDVVAGIRAFVSPSSFGVISDGYPTESSFSISFDVNLDSISTEQWLYSDWDEGDSQRQFAVRVKSGSVQVYGASDGSAAVQVASSTITSNRLLVDIVSDGAYVHSIINGTYSVTAINQRSGGTATKYLGTKNNEGSFLTGSFNHFEINKSEFDLSSQLTEVSGSNGGLVTLTGTTFTEGATSSHVAPLGADGFNVIALGGQSNMQGRPAIVSGIDDDYTDVSDVYQLGYDGKIIIQATNPLDYRNESATAMGLWLELVKAIKPSLDGRPILLLPLAEGGTGFVTNDWNKGNTNYEAARQRIAAVGGNSKNTMVGFFWFQGETDAENGNPDYLTSISTFWTDMKLDCDLIDDNTKFVAAKVKGDTYPTEIESVNADLTTFTNSILNGALVETSDLTQQDIWHFDAPSLRVIGQRMGAAYLAL